MMYLADPQVGACYTIRLIDDLQSMMGVREP